MNRDTKIRAGYQGKPDCLREAADKAFAGIQARSNEPGIHKLTKEQTDLYIPKYVPKPKGVQFNSNPNHFVGMGKSKDYDKK
jgi:hypothetical protein